MSLRAFNTANVVPLALEKRTAIGTAEAAYQLGLSPKTLRNWSMTGLGPLKPVRIGGRLVWNVAEIKRVLGGSE
jgi:hypothetical protein